MIFYIVSEIFFLLHIFIFYIDSEDKKIKGFFNVKSVTH
jgi:hypothetical protein